MDNQNQCRYPLDLDLAEAYIPFQEYNRRYSPKEGLMKGTIFPELYRPYRKKR
ncbi:hypothetical protein JCM16358_14510 [Halanaerocella petrolearia]